MEFKVWVEGLPRVVCGVTMETTCQEIVLALAHAIGRTGCFSLIERWRKSERALRPTELPLRLLQKLGEYAVEVNYVLIENYKNESSVNEASGDFPKISTNTTVKRSLTFTGAHGQPVRPSNKSGKVAPIYNASQLNSQSQNPSCEAQTCGTNSGQGMKNNSSSRLPLSQSYDSLERSHFKRSVIQKKLSNNRISDITTPPMHHSQPRNFPLLPYILPTSQNTVKQPLSNYNVPLVNGNVRNHVTRGMNNDWSRKYINLVQLVNRQHEHLSSQDAEIAKIDSDIEAAEQAEKENKNLIEKRDMEIRELNDKRQTYELELNELNRDDLDRELREQMRSEHILRQTLKDQQRRVQECDKQISEYNDKISHFNRTIKSTLDEFTVEDDISFKHNVRRSPMLGDLQSELINTEVTFQAKKEELGELVHGLQEENLKDFSKRVLMPSKEGESSIFKHLSRPASTNPLRRGEDNCTTIVTPPDGIWV